MFKRIAAVTATLAFATAFGGTAIAGPKKATPASPVSVTIVNPGWFEKGPDKAPKMKLGSRCLVNTAASPLENLGADKGDILAQVGQDPEADSKNHCPKGAMFFVSAVTFKKVTAAYWSHELRNAEAGLRAKTVLTRDEAKAATDGLVAAEKARVEEIKAKLAGK